MPNWIDLENGARAYIEGVPFFRILIDNDEDRENRARRARELWGSKKDTPDADCIRRIGLMHVGGRDVWRVELWLDLGESTTVFMGRSVPISRADLDREHSLSCLAFSPYSIDFEPGVAEIFRGRLRESARLHFESADP